MRDVIGIYIGIKEGLGDLGFRDITPPSEGQLEKQMETETENRRFLGVYRHCIVEKPV